MPSFSNVSHISFSVRDADVTAAWWRRVFGLEPLMTIDDAEGWRAVLLMLTDRIAIEFQEHDANGGEMFDPVRTGFDHMGLKVDARADLDEWQAHFERLGVTHTPVVDYQHGSVLTFKDPDLIQYEMFFREDHS